MYFRLETMLIFYVIQTKIVATKLDYYLGTEPNRIFNHCFLHRYVDYFTRGIKTIFSFNTSLIVLFVRFNQIIEEQGLRKLYNI